MKEERKQFEEKRLSTLLAPNLKKEKTSKREKSTFPQNQTFFFLLFLEKNLSGLPLERCWKGQEVEAGERPFPKKKEEKKTKNLKFLC